MRKVYYTAEELKKVFESPIWKILHENNVAKYFKVQNEKINKYLKHVFSCKCPSCNGILYYEEYDVACDRDIYKCSKCGELWF